MDDIFLSYASEDRQRIEPLVALLESEGWSVWWDRALIAGSDDLSSYSERVGREIASDFPHARRLARAFYRFPRLTFYLVKRNVALCQRFLDILTGELAYQQFNQRLKKDYKVLF